MGTGGARISPYWLLALAAAGWGAHWVVARGVIAEASPVALSFWRWACAMLLLAAFAAPHLRSDLPKLLAAWRPMLFFGTAGTVLYNAVGYTGLQTSTAINALLYQSVTPALIPVLGWLLFRERVRPRVLAGIAVSFLGVLAIASRLDPGRLAQLESAAGDLWLLANIAMWALYTVCLRWKPRAVHPVSFLFGLIAAGMLTGVPLFAADALAGGGLRWSAGAVAAVLFLGAVPSVACFLMWNRAVAEVGPAVAGVWSHLIPVTGALMAMAFLGERLAAYHLVGAALVFGGLALASRAPPGSGR